MGFALVVWRFVMSIVFWVVCVLFSVVYDLDLFRCLLLQLVLI